MSCYDATLGKPEGDFDAQQEQAFQKCGLEDMWDALEAKFGVSDAGNELYIMEQFYDYRMTEERSVVEQAHEI
jgi:hypothetical protein